MKKQKKKNTSHSINNTSQELSSKKKRVTKKKADDPEIFNKRLIQTHQLLKESEERFRAILNSTSDAIALSDDKGIVIAANPAYFSLYGYTEKEVIGKSFAIIFPKAQQNSVKKQYLLMFKARSIIPDVESTIVRADGVKRTVESKYDFIYENKKRIAMVSSIRDITDRKKADENLKLSEERLRLAMEAGKIGVWDWDIVNNKLTWSDRVYELYGTTRKDFEVNYTNFRKQLHPEDIKIAEDAIKHALDGSSPYNIAYRIVTLGGETKWISSRATVTRDSSGKPIRMIGATIDTTEQKKLEEDRNDFVSIATHELKTPVTSLKAYAEFLQRRFSKSGDIFSATQLGKMSAQLDKLTSLISDLLDATKIESGKLQMYEEKFEFDKLVSEIVEELQRTTEKHTLIITGKTNKKITADRERTGQVITNLISNAIKYSPHTDKIIVSCTSTETHVQICVQDFGVGIAKPKQKKLFERFYRISGPKNNTFPGLGLGLYISKEIVRRQHGKIWVESINGKGSTFCFSLPIKVKIKKLKNTLSIEEIKRT